MKGHTATVPAFLALLLLALFASHVDAAPFTSGQCNLYKLTDLSGKWKLRRDGGGNGSPIVAQTCCEQEVSWLWQDCQSKGLTPQPNNNCAIIVVGGSIMVPKGEVVSSYNPLETRDYGKSTFTWYIESIPRKGGAKYRIWRYDTYRPDQKLYVAANLSGSKNPAVVSPFVFEWDPYFKGSYTSPCEW